MSALALLPRFSTALPSTATALLGAVDVAGADSFVHRNYAALFASVPAVAVGSLALFALRDRAAMSASDGQPDNPADEAGTPTSTALPPRPDEELALVGVILAVMADRLEHDPAAYPLLACAAARLVPELVGVAGWGGWTGLTERARRAAVEVLRPTALSTLVRAATWGLVATGEPT